MSDELRMRIAGIAVVVGLALGLWGALAENPFDRWGGEQGLAATVNGVAVTVDDLTLAIEAVASDKRNDMTQTDRDRILGRLIDEELLIQRGVEVGLVDSDTTVRKAIVNAMIVSVLSEAQDNLPTDADLQALYDESPGLFSGAGRYQVEQIFLRRSDDLNGRINTLTAALAEGMDFAEAQRTFGDQTAIALPGSLLPSTKLREYTGPTAVSTISQLAVGDISSPVKVPGGVGVFRLVAKDDGTPRPFAQVRGLVAAEFARRRDDDALRVYLDWLWSRAEVEAAQGYTAKPELAR